MPGNEIKRFSDDLPKRIADLIASAVPEEIGRLLAALLEQAIRLSFAFHVTEEEFLALVVPIFRHVQEESCKASLMSMAREEWKS
jgi:hypothetical protein